MHPCSADDLLSTRRQTLLRCRLNVHGNCDSDKRDSTNFTTAWDTSNKRYSSLQWESIYHFPTLRGPMEVVEILPRGRQWPVYYTKSIWWRIWPGDTRSQGISSCDDWPGSLRIIWSLHWNWNVSFFCNVEDAHTAGYHKCICSHEFNMLYQGLSERLPIRSVSIIGNWSYRRPFVLMAPQSLSFHSRWTMSLYRFHGL